MQCRGAPLPLLTRDSACMNYSYQENFAKISNYTAHFVPLPPCAATRGPMRQHRGVNFRYSFFAK